MFFEQKHSARLFLICVFLGTLFGSVLCMESVKKPFYVLIEHGDCGYCIMMSGKKYSLEKGDSIHDCIKKVFNILKSVDVEGDAFVGGGTFGESDTFFSSRCDKRNIFRKKQKNVRRRKKDFSIDLCIFYKAQRDEEDIDFSDYVLPKNLKSVDLKIYCCTTINCNCEILEKRNVAFDVKVF